MPAGAPLIAPASAPETAGDHGAKQPLSALPSGALVGTIKVPGDKSISHRALMLGALAVGETRIAGLLEGEDVLGTARVLAALGAEVAREEESGLWSVWGRGVGGLSEPDDLLDFGNSGTGVRLAMGVIAGQPISAVLSGDVSLRRRPMERVMAPLRQMGVRFQARSGGRLPMAMQGPETLLPIEYELPVASAQVKSAVLLAGLAAPGRTTVIEPHPTRDHSERMLRHFGAEIAVEDIAGGGRRIAVTGEPELTGCEIAVPADPSSAAFPLVAALLLPGSELRLPGVCLNPHRAGLIATLQEMGGDIALENAREEGGEPVADLFVRSSRLHGIEVPAERAPAMIDEYPILAVAAACAEGTTVMQGLGELRVKESDRLAATARGLAQCGLTVEEGEDSLTVEGAGGPPPGGNNQPIATELDHRIAMSFLILGLASARPVTVDDAAPIATSFPGFVALMGSLGAGFETAA